MLIDCFMFFNELDILEGRLAYLYNKVDYFVIVETDITHSGNPKPLNFFDNQSRYIQYSDKIVYCPFSYDVSRITAAQLPPDKTPHWVIENDQRNYISSALRLFPEDATVIVSDVDEIPCVNALTHAANLIASGIDAVTMEQDLFYYNFNQKQINPWPGSVVSSNKYTRSNTPQFLRDTRWNRPKILNGGWHLSYWGTPASISSKISSFAHQEFNTPEFTDPEKIKFRINNNQDPFGRTDYSNKLINMDIQSLPPDLVNIFGKYSKTFI